MADKVTPIRPHKSTGFTKLTHDELRDRWLATSPPVTYTRGAFRRYENGLWTVIEETVIRQEVARVIEKAKSEAVKPTIGLLNSVMGLTVAKCAVVSDTFDAQAELLVCGNGTLYIPTRALRDWDVADYATSGVAYDFNAAATCPNWTRYVQYLAAALGADTVAFLQEFAGYAITTDTSHELAVWLWGPPGSGKSTFIEGVRAALSDRAGVLGLSQIERSSFALVAVPGKTLLISTEQPSGFIRCTPVLNALISGEHIQIEYKYKDAFEFRPCAKLLWAMNELPKINAPTSGLFRRICVVEFPQLANEKRDAALREAIKTEGCGILLWLLDGLDRLTTRGKFEIPAAIQATTQAFRDNCDVAASCLAEIGEFDAEAAIQSSELYAAYFAWCKDTGHRPASSTSIADDWKRLGLTRYRSMGKTRWLGFRLNSGE